MIRGLVAWNVGIGVGFSVMVVTEGVDGLHPALISNKLLIWIILRHDNAEGID